jgi:hypothetical protein
LTGDKNCHFIFSPSNDVQSMVIKPGSGNSVFIRAIYKPKKLGEDHGHIRVTSNAENLPSLALPICGRAISKYAPGKDSGPSPDSSASEFLICKDDSNPVVHECHK